MSNSANVGQSDLLVLMVLFNWFVVLGQGILSDRMEARCFQLKLYCWQPSFAVGRPQIAAIVIIANSGHCNNRTLIARISLERYT
jgi:hypothetical protein